MARSDVYGVRCIVITIYPLPKKCNVPLSLYGGARVTQLRNYCICTCVSGHGRLLRTEYRTIF